MRQPGVVKNLKGIVGGLLSELRAIGLRHTMLLDCFHHHISPTDYFIIFSQRKRTDLARPMALDAMLLKQANDLIAIGYRRIAARLSRSSDQTADGFGSRYTDRLIIQVLFDRGS